MTVTSRSTKAQLLAHIAVQDAALLAQGHTIRALRDELSMARPAAPAPAPALAPAAHVEPAPSATSDTRDTHTAYYAYVKAQRLAAKLAKLRTVTYKSFAQWNATGSAPSVRANDFAACELDLINLRADRAAPWSVA